MKHFLKGLLVPGAFIISAAMTDANAAPVFQSVQGRNSIAGRVTSSNEAGVANVAVFLLNDGYGQRAQTYTDGSGRFYFRNLSTGNYYVQVEGGSAGFERQTQRIEVNPYDPSGSTGGRETFRIDFVLKSVSSTNKRTSSEPAVPGAASVLFVQDVPVAAKDAYRQGEESLKKSDLKTAEKSLVRAIELFPDYYDALDLLGSEYVRHEFFDDAAPLLAHAVEVNKNAWHSFYGLGVSLIELNRRVEGLEALRRAVSLNANSVNASMRLGLELSKDEVYTDEAIKLFTVVTKKAGKQMPEAFLALAALYSKKTEYRDAAEALAEYLRVVPHAEHRDEIKRKIQELRQKESKAAKSQ